MRLKVFVKDNNIKMSSENASIRFSKSFDHLLHTCPPKVQTKNNILSLILYSVFLIERTTDGHLTRNLLPKESSLAINSMTFKSSD